MKFTKIAWLAVIAAGAALAGACNDGKTYAELLSDENQTVNRYLADQRVVGSIPPDTVFEVGPDAPYYRLDEDGNLYMQVLEYGTPGNMAKSNELLYFRFSRYQLSDYQNGTFSSSEGNDDVMNGNYSFRYGNYELQSSYSYGAGIQAPLEYLPVDCRVNIVIKSSYGAPGEMSNVVPYLYSLRYYRPKF